MSHYVVDIIDGPTDLPVEVVTSWWRYNALMDKWTEVVMGRVEVPKSTFNMVHFFFFTRRCAIVDIFEETIQEVRMNYIPGRKVLAQQGLSRL